MSKPLVCMIFATALLFGECVQAPTAGQSRLEVIAIDITGAPIPGVEVQLTLVDHDRKALQVGPRGIRVPYGRYQLKAHASGFASARREILVHQPETIVRVELAIGAIGCPPPPAEISGRVKHDNRGELWVKAVTVRGVDGGESRVSSSGYFLISGLEYSTYVVLVMQGESVVYQKVVKTYPLGTSGLSQSNHY